MNWKVRNIKHPTMDCTAYEESNNYFIGYANSPDVGRFMGSVGPLALSKHEWEKVTD